MALVAGAVPGSSRGARSSAASESPPLPAACPLPSLPVPEDGAAPCPSASLKLSPALGAPFSRAAASLDACSRCERVNSIDSKEELRQQQHHMQVSAAYLWHRLCCAGLLAHSSRPVLQGQRRQLITPQSISRLPLPSALLRRHHLLLLAHHARLALMGPPGLQSTSLFEVEPPVPH